MPNSQSPHAWRPIIALLANPDARAVYAQVVLGAGPDAGRVTVSASKRVRILDQLVGAGLARREGGDVVADESRLVALLAENADQRPRSGPERYFRSDGSIDRYPANHGERVELLRVVASRVIAPAERLTEPELNARLESFDADTARLRRHLVDHGILTRTPSGSSYALPGSIAGARDPLAM